jgi:phage I-like protein
MAQGLQGMKPNVTIIGNQGNNMLNPYVESAYQMAPFLKEMLGNLNLTENKKKELTNLLNPLNESERY